MMRIGTLAFALALVLAAFGASNARAAETSFKKTIGGGDTFSFKLPVIGFPVTVTVSTSPNNGGTPNPSSVVMAVISQDPSTGNLSWIAINAGGEAATANNTASTAIVATFASGATLQAAGGTSHVLGTLTLDNSGSGIPTLYYVTMTH